MSPDDVSRALVEATQSISSLLSAARKLSENLSDFVESGLGPGLGPAIGVIAKLLKDLEIGDLAWLAARSKCLNLIILDSWEKFDQTIKTWYKYCQVREAVEEFLRTETEWNTFLASLDRKMSGAGPRVETLKVGDLLTCDINLLEAR